MVQLIEAIATDHARRVNTKYGERTVIDAIRRDNGEKVTVWRGGDDDYSQRHVIKNARLTLTLDSKGKYNLVEDPNLANLGQPLPDSPVPVKPVSRYLASNNPSHYDYKIEKSNENDQSTLNPNQKREIAQYIQEMAKLYGFCLNQADSLGVDGEDRRAIATTLYLSAQKKFAL
jgi:cephalosporin hydroxylase